MIDTETTFAHQFFQIPIAERIPEVPSHTQHDQLVLKVSSLEHRWSVPSHSATLTASFSFCDTTVERIKVPQADFFGFGEKLAVIEQGTTDPQGMGFIYDKVAAFVAADFADIGALLGEQAEYNASRSTESVGPQNIKQPEVTGYLYDLFVSYDPSLSEWVLEFVETLRAELGILRAEEPRIFVDLGEIRVGPSRDEEIEQALIRSKVLIAALTPQYLASQASVRELMTFRTRTSATGKAMILPLLIRGGDSLFQILTAVRGFDFRKFSVQKSPDKRKSSGLQREIMQLADHLSEMIDEAPTYDPSWTIASNAEASELTAQVAQASKNDWRKQILWVDDRPDNNVYERRTIESLGVTFSLAYSTQEAFQFLSNRRFGVIISDMAREEGPSEGYVLLDRLRRHGDTTPFIIYAGSNAAKYKSDAEARGAQGSTSNPQELFQMVRDALLQSSLTS